MPTYRTFGIEYQEVLDKIRRFHPILRPEVSYSLDESLEKLVKYLLRGRGSEAVIKVQTERIDGETVVFAKLDEGVIIFNTVYPDEVVNFMRRNYPLLPPYKVRDERTPKGWTKTTQGVRPQDENDLEAIKAIAQQARKACELQWPEPAAFFGAVESCLVGRCIPCTEFLVQRLRAAGFPAKRAWGLVWVDGYFLGDEWGGEVMWLPEPRYPSSHDNWFDHQFAWIDGLVVDITGDQFNELIQDPEEKIPPVLIAKWEDLSRYKWLEGDPQPHLIPYGR